MTTSPPMMFLIFAVACSTFVAAKRLSRVDVVVFAAVSGMLGASGKMTPPPITRACPLPTPGMKSASSVKKAFVTFENHAPFAVKAYWVDFAGEEKENGEVASAQVVRSNSFVGHVMRHYYEGNGQRTLVSEYVVSDSAKEHPVAIKSCVELAHLSNDTPLDGGRGAEFEKLAQDPNAPCEPVGRSDLWSCSRHITKTMLAERPKHLYGFLNQEESGSRKVGETTDNGYVRHIPKMPRVTDGPGFLRMNFTESLNEVRAWVEANIIQEMEVHDVISGGYTNNHIHLFSKLNLDRFPEVRKQIVGEMRLILQWWTQMRLKHTDTFGVRIYHRHSMLINHVDRDQTHIASAVIQFAQGVDVDGGWPLEVIDEQGETHEVYLQPGQLVLYEGGKLKHGRPMRLRGDNFSNVFSHFAPLEWYGPNDPESKVSKDEL